MTEHDASGLLRALEQRRVRDVELDARLLELHAARRRLLEAQLRQLHIHPARKEVELVPGGLAMAQEDELGVRRGGGGEARWL